MDKIIWPILPEIRKPNCDEFTMNKYLALISPMRKLKKGLNGWEEEKKKRQSLVLDFMGKH